MPVWHIHIKGIHTLQEEQLEGTITFEEMRDGIVVILKRELAYEEGIDPSLDEVIDELKDADSVEAYDIAKDELYNWADKERVWIDPDV